MNNHHTTPHTAKNGDIHNDVTTDGEMTHTTPELPEELFRTEETDYSIGNSGTHKVLDEDKVLSWHNRELSTQAHQHKEEVRSERKRIYAEIENRLHGRPKKKNNYFYNVMHNAEVTGWNKCLWKVKNICKLLDKNGKSLTTGKEQS